MFLPVRMECSGVFLRNASAACYFHTSSSGAIIVDTGREFNFIAFINGFFHIRYFRPWNSTFIIQCITFTCSNQFSIFYGSVKGRFGLARIEVFSRHTRNKHSPYFKATAIFGSNSIQSVFIICTFITDLTRHSTFRFSFHTIFADWNYIESNQYIICCYPIGAIR